MRQLAGISKIAMSVFLAGALSACGGGETRADASSDAWCVPVEEGASFRVESGRLVPSDGGQLRLAANGWTGRVEGVIAERGFSWLKLDVRNVGAGVLTLTGTAPSEAAKAAGLQVGEAAIKAQPEGRDLLVIDGIAVEGGDEAVGAALSELDDAPGVAECQRAFTRVMEGRNVSFSTAGAQIDDRSARLLDAATGVAILCKDYEIEVAGHSDRRGDPIDNQRLSEARASRVRDYLVDRGVPGEALTAVGYGAARLLDERDTPEAHRRNRRTEFVVRERGQ